MKYMTNEYGHCPNCNVDLDGGSIWEHFFRETGDEREATKIADMYGATRERGKFGRQIALYDRDKDCTVGWKCPDCGHTWERT